MGLLKLPSGNFGAQPDASNGGRWRRHNDRRNDGEQLLGRHLVYQGAFSVRYRELVRAGREKATTEGNRDFRIVLQRCAGDVERPRDGGREDGARIGAGDVGDAG